MKAVILAGGYGTRISEESHLKPKPMIEIGGKPILWHIMKIYASYGINDFIICCGYKAEIIKEYFSNQHKDWNIDLIQEMSFQGGDGYQYFMNHDLAFAAISRIIEFCFVI